MKSFANIRGQMKKNKQKQVFVKTDGNYIFIIMFPFLFFSVFLFAKINSLIFALLLLHTTLTN